jgi:hypothetical protein
MSDAMDFKSRRTFILLCRLSFIYQRKFKKYAFIVLIDLFYRCCIGFLMEDYFKYAVVSKTIAWLFSVFCDRNILYLNLDFVLANGKKLF